MLSVFKNGEALWRGLLKGFEQQAEEDIDGEQHQRENDGAAQAAPGGHAFLFLFL